MTEPPYGRYPPPGSYAPFPAPPKRHRLRNLLIGAAAGLVLLVVAVAAAATGSKTTPPPVGGPTLAPPSSPAATVAAAPPAPVKRVLIRFTGSGIENSAPFDVGPGPLTVHYSFNCASQGQAGNFIADLLYGNQASLSSDDDSIANDLAVSGAQTTTVYPQYPGRDYYLSVDSECSWRIRVTGVR